MLDFRFTLDLDGSIGASYATTPVRCDDCRSVIPAEVWVMPRLNLNQTVGGCGNLTLGIYCLRCSEARGTRALGIIYG